MATSSPYANPCVEIDDVSPFFVRDEKAGTETFIGETLEVRIPKRFEVYDLLTVSDTVTALGIMDLVINGRFHRGMVILNQLHMEPSEITEMVYDNVPYIVLHFAPGDVFIRNIDVVKEDRVIYAVYVEFISCGKPIYFLEYFKLGNLFDRAKPMTGSGIGVDRVVFELIVSHLARSPDDLYLPYRLTDMKEPMRLIPLKQVSHSTTSTTSRLVGSYHKETTAAALITDNTENYPLELILRGFPYVPNKPTEGL